MAKAIVPLLIWFSGFIVGTFAMVADELQALPWNGIYNFPIIGQLSKFGGYLSLGAWDLVFGVLLSGIVLGFIAFSLDKQ